MGQHIASRPASGIYQLSPCKHVLCLSMQAVFLIQAVTPRYATRSCLVWPCGVCKASGLSCSAWDCFQMEATCPRPAHLPLAWILPASWHMHATQLQIPTAHHICIRGKEMLALDLAARISRQSVGWRRSFFRCMLLCENHDSIITQQTLQVLFIHPVLIRPWFYCHASEQRDRSDGLPWRPSRLAGTTPRGRAGGRHNDTQR